MNLVVMSESRETVIFQKVSESGQVDRRAKRAADGLETHVEVVRRAKRAADGLSKHYYLTFFGKYFQKNHQ